jgi:hypothetical protein
MTECVLICAVNVHQVKKICSEVKQVAHGFDKQELEHVRMIIPCELAFVPENLSEANNAQAVE